MLAPLSSHSARITQARKLRRRRHRTQTGLFLSEGPQAVREAVIAGAVREAYCSDPQVAELLIPADTTGYLVEQSVIDSLCESEHPQPIVAVCAWAPCDPAVMAAPTRLGLLAHEVREPGNAGALMRVADAVGADWLVLGAGSVDPTNAKAVRASTGSLFHLPILTGLAMLPIISELRERGVQVLAADVSPAAVELFSYHQLAAPTVWLFGNEAHGLPAELREAADEVVRIPIYGRAESLNLATAAAVCLYASARSQREADPT